MKLAELQFQQHGQKIKAPEVGRTGPDGAGRTDRPGAAREPFADVLSQKIGKESSVHFSAHAAKRMLERNILPTEDELTRLTTGFEKARAKGADSSLILVDENAFVVSIRNDTVITALNREMATGNVFSNIDSVAIV